MIGLKTLGMLLIFGASTAAGFIYSESFKKRYSQLQEIQRAIYQFQVEIEYTHTPIPEAMLNVANKSKEPIAKIFREISAALEKNEAQDVYEAFTTAFNGNKSSLCLSSEDMNIILDMAKVLGEADIEGHKKVFNYTLEKLKNQIKIAEELVQKNVKMYRYLGVTVGGMTVIMLI